MIERGHGTEEEERGSRLCGQRCLKNGGGGTRKGRRWVAR